MLVAAALATLTVLALRDDRPRRRRDWRTLEQRPATRGPASRSPPGPTCPRSTRRGPDRASRARPIRGTFARLLIPGFLIALGAGQVIPFLNVFIEGKFGLDLAVAQRGLRDHEPRDDAGDPPPARPRPAVREGRLGRPRPGREHPVPRRAGLQPDPVDGDRRDGGPQLAHERRQPDRQRVRDGAAAAAASGRPTRRPRASSGRSAGSSPGRGTASSRRRSGSRPATRSTSSRSSSSTTLGTCLYWRWFHARSERAAARRGAAAGGLSVAAARRPTAILGTMAEQPTPPPSPTPAPPPPARRPGSRATRAATTSG